MAMFGFFHGPLNSGDWAEESDDGSRHIEIISNVLMGNSVCRAVQQGCVGLEGREFLARAFKKEDPQ